MADSSGNSNKRRLLRLKLTDGQSEITAVEYSHIQSIPDDIVPGTKVYIYISFVINFWYMIDSYMSLFVSAEFLVHMQYTLSCFQFVV